MGIVKLKKSNILKFLILITFMLFGYKNVNATEEVVLTFTNSKIKETISGSGYKISGTELTINSSGIYRIKGSSVNGNIIVKKGTTGVTLILDNLDLTSSKTAPLTINKDGAEVNLKLVGTNTLIDNEDPDNEFNPDPNINTYFEGAAIKVKSESSLTISGYGTLNAVGNTNNAIKGGSKSSIKINSGNINISAQNNGISCDGTITINGGNIDIDRALNEGIKLSPDEGDNESLAELRINGGTINIKSDGDAIQAQGNIYINNNPKITIDTLQDGIQTRSNFYMTNGTLNIKTYEGYEATTFDKETMSAKGIKAAISDDDVEGATNLLSITGGKIEINSSDDAIHSDGDVILTIGEFKIRTFDDAIHADSKLIIGTKDTGLERDPLINILNSREGLEAGNIFIYSGKIKVIATDDGINAAGGASSGDGSSPDDHYNPITGEDRFAIYVYGGKIYINSGTDGFDANGSLYFYGGTSIVYSQGRDGTNSALDRDAHLVIDGATVFTSGSVGTNGEITNIESKNGQEFISITQDYNQGDKIAVKDNDVLVFNTEIIKDTEYVFYTSPTLSNNASISLTDELDDLYDNPWNHTFSDGVITQVATKDAPGIISYTCDLDAIIERQTYFYDNDVVFNVINRTNATARVNLGNISDRYDFTAPAEKSLTIYSEVPIYLITSTDNGTTFSYVEPTSLIDNVYTFNLDDTVDQNLYVAYKGDANISGYITAYDEYLIQKSLLNQDDPLYLPLTNLETLVADTNKDGIINQEDIAYIKNIQLHLILDYDYKTNQTSDKLKLTNTTTIDAPVHVDGTESGTIDVYVKAGENLSLDAFEAMFIPNPYFTITNVEPIVQGGSEMSSPTNNMLYLVNINGWNISENDNIYKVTFNVDKDTPTGKYSLILKVGVFTLHGSSNEDAFNISTDIYVDGILNPYKASFDKDEGVESIDLYYNQNYTTPTETITNDSSFAYARNSASGELDVSGDGQISFRVNLKPGYVISSVTASPADNFKNVKGPADTDAANTYRITKITGDIVIEIITKQALEYEAIFNKDSHITQIDNYYTKDYTNPDETNITKAYARSEDFGTVDITGEGQINFKIIPDEGYKVDTVKVSGNYKNLKGPADTKVDNMYRITKVSGDLIVDVTSKKRTPVTVSVSDYETSYEFTDAKIKPEVTVTVNGEDVTLVKDVDYKVKYGNNKVVGQNSGSITITSISNSDYMFDPVVVNFDIVEYELDDSNIDVQNSIAYTGNILSPRISVHANDKDLILDEDYTVTYTNQDGLVGDNVSIKVTGIGNYTGTIDNILVPIVVKPMQEISFGVTELTVVYGENFIESVTQTLGDGNITYTSSDQGIVVVNYVNGAAYIRQKGDVVITATAAETDTYAETTASYIIHVLPKELSIYSAEINDKLYDGTATADVTSVRVVGYVNDEHLVDGTDYTYTSEFVNPNVGTDKDVTVTVTLSEDISKKYSLPNNVFIGKASINGVTINASDITLDPDNFNYDGTEKVPDVIISVNGRTLVRNTDYSVRFENNINAGTAYAIVKGIGNYITTEDIYIPYIINKMSVTPSISNIESVVFNNSVQMPSITVTASSGSIILEENKDYKVTYENNINAGDGVVKITPVSDSNYTFDASLPSASKVFTINPYALTQNDVVLSSNYASYDGTEKEVGVTVKANGITLDKDIDYTVDFTNNINVSSNAKVTVTAISQNYSGIINKTFEIIDKDILEISGINNNQVIKYTGEEVVLDGNIIVSTNTDNITKDDLTVKYYDKNNNLINRPSNIGKYSVVYSYENDNYIGEKKINFEIIKADSINPDEVNNIFDGLKDNKLSSIEFTSTGLTWDNPNEAIKEGYNSYSASYVKDSDLNHYTVNHINITVYGKVKTDINTSVNGLGGTITSSSQDVLEGTTKTITVTPNEGYRIKNVTINGEEVGVNSNNTISVTAGKEDLNIVASFEEIIYELNISGSNVVVDPNGIIEVDYNSSENLVIDTKKGYKLTSITINNVENIDSLNDKTLSLNNISEDTNVVIKAQKISYEVVEGARQTYTINEDDKATFKVNAAYSLFKNGGAVLVDKTIVDEGSYTSKDGSVIINFNKEFLDSLALGVHTLDVKLTDGGTASTTFTIAKVTTRTITNNSSTNKGNSGSYVTDGTSKKNSNIVINPNTSASSNNKDSKNSSSNTIVKPSKKVSTKNNNKKSPTTGDTIMKYFFISITSLLVIIIFIVLLKRKNKKDDID